MRCDCCNRKLNDYECSLKSSETGLYLNTCTTCLEGLSIKATGNSSLAVGAQVDFDDLSDDLVEEEWVFDVPDNKSIEDES